MGNYITTYTGEIPQLHIDLDYTVRPFREVEKEYPELYYRYSGDTVGGKYYGFSGK